MNINQLIIIFTGLITALPINGVSKTVKIMRDFNLISNDHITEAFKDILIFDEKKEIIDDNLFLKFLSNQLSYLTNLKNNSNPHFKIKNIK